MTCADEVPPFVQEVLARGRAGALGCSTAMADGSWQGAAHVRRHYQAIVDPAVAHPAR